jgi:type IV pilus assembly protein PilE
LNCAAVKPDNRRMTNPAALHQAKIVKTRGFTLIELMIVVAIAAVLAAVAFPSFQGQIRKSRRAEAVSTLSQIQQAQERWRANCTTYASNIASAPAANCTGGLGVAAPAGARYNYPNPTGVSGTTYTITATAIAGSSQASDTGCTVITTAVASGVATNTPTQCWSR